MKGFVISLRFFHQTWSEFLTISLERIYLHFGRTRTCRAAHCLCLINTPLYTHAYQDFAYKVTSAYCGSELILSSPEPEMGSCPIRIRLPK